MATDIYKGHKYVALVDTRHGYVTLFVDGDNHTGTPYREIAFMQGDEATEFEQELIDAENLEYPRGPYETSADCFDVLIGAYDNA